MSKLLKLQEVITITRHSRSFIYKLISNGEFPKPLKMSHKSIAWLESDIEKYINDKVKQRDEK